MNPEELQSKTLDFIRFPISIGVVFIHNSYGGGIISPQNIDWAALTGSNLFDLFRLLSKNLATIATPYFFLISGYFYFRRMEVFNRETYIAKTINRIKTVLVPYIIWNLLAFLIPMITAVVKGDLHSYLMKFADINPLCIFWNYKYYILAAPNLFGHIIYEAAPLNVPLWFLRDLFIMSMLSPLIYLFVKKTKFYGIGLLAICYLTSTWTSITGFRVIAVFFFILGAYLGINKENLVLVARKYKLPIILICLTTVILDTCFLGDQFQVVFIRPLYRVTGLLSFIILGSYVIERGWVTLSTSKRTIAKVSFFIYVSHAVSVLGIMIKAYSRFFHPETPFGKGVIYMCVSVTTVLICIATYFILKKLFPKFTNLVTGDR